MMADQRENLCSYCGQLNNHRLRGQDTADDFFSPNELGSCFKLRGFWKSKSAASPTANSNESFCGLPICTVLSQRNSCRLCFAISNLLKDRLDFQEDLNRRVALRFVTKSAYTSDGRSSYDHSDHSLRERKQTVSSVRIEKKYGIAGLGIDIETTPGSGSIPEAAELGLRVFKPAGLTCYDDGSGKSGYALAELERSCPRTEIEPSISAKTVDLVKGWLSNCLENHSNSKTNQCDQTVSGARLDDRMEQSPLPTRLIAVNPKGSPKIVVTKKTFGSYVALSYRWGSVTSDMWRLRRDNIRQSLQLLPYSSLPATIQDAIELTRRLGFEFLWIDSCCIVQDDKEDWEQEAATMQAVYQNATMTITVLGDRDSHTGFLQRREASTLIRIPWLDEDGNKVADVLVSGDLPFQKPSNRDECISDLEHELNESPWSTRGWTFQENLLSRRQLYVGQHQLFFECRKEKRSENGFDQTLKTPSNKQSFIEALDSDFSTALHNLLKDPESQGAPAWMSRVLKKTHDPVVQIQRKYLKFDMAQTKINIDSLLFDYTSRSLTNQGDKLIAFEGLARAVASRSGQEFCAGLWTNKIAKSLFWWLRDGPEALSHELRAPTWSWASRDGVIKGYDTEMLTNDDMRVERKHIDRGAFDGALTQVEIMNGNFLVQVRPGARAISLQLKAACFKMHCSTEPAARYPLTWQQLQRDIRLWSSANTSWDLQHCHLLFATIGDAIRPKDWLQKRKRGELRRCPKCQHAFGEMDDHTILSHIERCVRNEPVEDALESASPKSLVGVACFDEPQHVPASFEMVLLWRARSINTFYRNTTIWPDLWRRGAEGLARSGEYQSRYGWTVLKPSEEKILGIEGQDVYFSMDDIGSGAAFIKDTNPKIFFCLLAERTEVEGAYRRCGVALAYWINGANGSSGFPLHLNYTERVMTLV